MNITCSYFDYITTLIKKYQQHLESAKSMKDASLDNLQRWEKIQKVDFSETRQSLIYYEKLHIKTFSDLIDEYDTILRILRKENENEFEQR